jgi:hypothetical protein
MGSASLARGSLDSDHDVTKQRSAVVAVPALHKREREDIGRSVLPPMLEIQCAHVVVIHERDREFRARTSEFSKQMDSAGAKQARVDPS